MKRFFLCWAFLAVSYSLFSQLDIPITDFLEHNYDVFTPKGTNVRTWEYIGIGFINPQQIIDQNNYWFNKFPTGAQYDSISSSTYDYNCHGYAWLISEAVGVVRWMHRSIVKA